MKTFSSRPSKIRRKIAFAKVFCIFSGFCGLAAVVLYKVKVNVRPNVCSCKSNRKSSSKQCPDVIESLEMIQHNPQTAVTWSFKVRQLSSVTPRVSILLETVTSVPTTHMEVISGTLASHLLVPNTMTSTLSGLRHRPF